MKDRDTLKWEHPRLIIYTNEKGVVLATEGGADMEGIPRKGDLVEDFWSLFYGILPLSGQELDIPNAHVLNGVYYVKLQKDGGRYKILFFDVREKVATLEKNIQQRHQQSIIDTLRRKNSYSNLSCEILSNLGFMTFFRAGELWRLMGNVPIWFLELFPNYNFSSSYFDLPDIFPFLELFLGGEPQEKLRVSGFWIEESPVGTEYILQANRVSREGEDYVFIETINERFEDNYNIIQFAREQQLHFEKLRKTEKELRKTLEFKQKFISIITHDIKSPVVGIYSVFNHLLNDSEFVNAISGEHKHFLSVISQELQNIQGYVDTLYQWSLVQSNDIALKKKRLNLNQLFQIILMLYKNQLEEKELKVSLEIPEDIYIMADGIFIKNAFSNLFSNAIKFSYPEGKIDVRALVSDDYVEIVVEDYGIGMSPERIKEIYYFDKKESTPGTKGEKGIGIGMNIVKMIFDFHHAKIDIQSSLGKGTRFKVLFPRYNISII